MSELTSEPQKIALDNSAARDKVESVKGCEQEE